jgi:hypothetical protein
VPFVNCYLASLLVEEHSCPAASTCCIPRPHLPRACSTSVFLTSVSTHVLTFIHDGRMKLLDVARLCPCSLVPLALPPALSPLPPCRSTARTSRSWSQRSASLLVAPSVASTGEPA